MNDFEAGVRTLIEALRRAWKSTFEINPTNARLGLEALGDPFANRREKLA